MVRLCSMPRLFCSSALFLVGFIFSASEMVQGTSEVEPVQFVLKPAGTPLTLGHHDATSRILYQLETPETTDMMCIMMDEEDHSTCSGHFESDLGPASSNGYLQFTFTSDEDDMSIALVLPEEYRVLQNMDGLSLDDVRDSTTMTLEFRARNSHMQNSTCELADASMPKVKFLLGEEEFEVTLDLMEKVMVQVCPTEVYTSFEFNFKDLFSAAIREDVDLSSYWPPKDGEITLRSASWGAEYDLGLFEDVGAQRFHYSTNMEMGFTTDPSLFRGQRSFSGVPQLERTIAEERSFATSSSSRTFRSGVLTGALFLSYSWFFGVA